MATDVEEILLEAEEAMDKAEEYLRSELRGVRAGRATPGLVEHVKVDYFGASTELRQLANIMVPERSQIVVKPFDPSSMDPIAKSLGQAGLGLNPVKESKQIRITLPSISGERREELKGTVKKMGEQSKVVIRNARRDANKQVDQATKDKQAPLPRDDAEDAKERIQKLLKKYEGRVDDHVNAKIEEIEQG
jgi:ribosome recycling factor